MIRLKGLKDGERGRSGLKVSYFSSTTLVSYYISQYHPHFPQCRPTSFWLRKSSDQVQDMRKTTQLKHSSTPGLEADIMRSLVITANDDTNSQSNDRPTLPAELISKIILELQQDRQYAVLAKMAQVNSTFYDLVISKLYETITITEDNKYVISHGIHPSQHHRWIIFLDENGIDQDYIEPPPKGYKTRKDRAFECCVGLIVDTPVEDLVQSIEDIVDLLPQDRLGNVEELVFTGRALMRTTYDDVVYDLAQILPPFTPVMAADEFNQLPRTKRVILHIVADDFRRESPR